MYRRYVGKRLPYKSSAFARWTAVAGWHVPKSCSPRSGPPHACADRKIEIAIDAFFSRLRQWVELASERKKTSIAGEKQKYAGLMWARFPAETVDIEQS